MRILDIYQHIETTNYYDLRNHQHQNELLGEFIDREAYIARDEDDNIQAVAVYTSNKNPSFGWIEGLAVHPDSRKKHVGSYMVQRLVKIAQLDDCHELQLDATESAVSFWQCQGFESLGEEPRSDKLLRMNLRIK